MSGTKAEIEITASTARLPAALRSALKMVQGFVAATTGLLKKRSEAEMAKPDRRSLAVGSFLGGVGANLAMRGIDVMVKQTKEVFDFEKALTRFGISAEKTPNEMRRIGDAARATSNATGLSALEVLNAAKAYVDLAGAESFTINKMNILAKASQASGAATSDLAGMMYQLNQSMHISDADMENVMGGLLNQAKAGGIEAAQMSAEFAGALPLFARFGVLGREGTLQAGAMFQVMRDGANSASEAGTMVQRMFASAASQAPRFEAAGVRMFEKFRDASGKKVLRPFMEIFNDPAMVELMKDSPALKKVVGRTEGWRGFLLLGEQIVKFQNLIAKGRENGVIPRDLLTATESTFGRMEIAVEKVKNKFADMLTPTRIDQIVGGLEKIANAIGPVISMAGFAVDAFGALIDAGRFMGNTFRRGKQGMTDEDYEFYQANRLTMGTATPEVKARMKRIAEHSNTVDELEALERGHKPTTESVSRAVAIVRANMTPADQLREFGLGEISNNGSNSAAAAVDYLQNSGAGSVAFDKEFKKQLTAERAKQAAEAAAEVERNLAMGKGFSKKYVKPLDAEGRAAQVLEGTNPDAPSTRVPQSSRRTDDSLFELTAAEFTASMRATLKELGPILAEAMRGRPVAATVSAPGNGLKLTVEEAPANRSRVK